MSTLGTTRGIRIDTQSGTGISAGMELPPRPSHWQPWSRAAGNYLTSTVAPASTNFFLIVSASSLVTASLIGLGAPSTRSLASFKPRLVTSRTALITLILLGPSGGQNHRELRLRLGHRSRRSRTARNHHRSRRRSRYAQGLFQFLHQLRSFQQRQSNNLFLLKQPNPP